MSYKTQEKFVQFSISLDNQLSYIDMGDKYSVVVQCAFLFLNLIRDK